MKDLSWTCVGCALLALLVSFTAGCGYRTSITAPTGPPPVSPANYPLFILGKWSGMMGKNQITYLFNGDNTVSVTTQTGKGSVVANGTYTVDSNKLTIHRAGPKAKEETHTIALSLSGEQLTLQDTGLALARQPTPMPYPFEHSGPKYLWGPGGPPGWGPGGPHYGWGPGGPR